jgi:hypothetical protein
MNIQVLKIPGVSPSGEILARKFAHSSIKNELLLFGDEFFVAWTRDAKAVALFRNMAAEVDAHLQDYSPAELLNHLIPLMQLPESVQNKIKEHFPASLSIGADPEILAQKFRDRLDATLCSIQEVSRQAELANDDLRALRTAARSLLEFLDNLPRGFVLPTAEHRCV